LFVIYKKSKLFKLFKPLKSITNTAKTAINYFNFKKITQKINLKFYNKIILFKIA